MSEKKEEPITDKKVSRRSLLKYTGALAAGVVVGVAAEYGATYKPPPPPPPSFKPPLSADVQARVDQLVTQLKDRHVGETIYYESCAQNGCRGGNCIIRFRVKNGVITAIETDDLINSGKIREDVGAEAEQKGAIQFRACAMGRAWRQTLYNPKRTVYPMKRVGQRGEGKFVRISWNEALDSVANNMKQMGEKYGPLSVFARSNRDLFNYVNLGFTSHGNCSSIGTDTAYLYHIGTDGNAYGEGTETRDVLSSKLVVFWGYSVAAANGANVPYYFALARERGIPIIVIDSRYSWDAEIYADQWIPIRANTDTAMLLAVANVLFKEDLYDHDFVNKYVEPTGFQKWKDYVLGNTAGPDGKIDRTPEWAEIICGVPAQTIKEFARLFAKTTPCHFRLGIGPARREFGEDYASAGMCLMSMTGNVAKNGTYGFYSHARPTPRYVTPDQTAVYQKIAPTYKMPDLLDGSEKMGEALVKRDLFDKGAITQEQYNQYVSGRPGDPVPNIKMIWETVNKVCGSYPCTSKVIQGFKRVDFIVIYGGTYSDESLRYADLILPRVCGFFEEDAFHASSWETGPQFFVYHPAVINLPGEVAPTEWPLIQIANRLGFADKYNPRMKDVALDKWGQEMSKVSQQAYETWAARKDDIMPLNPPSWSNFQKSPVYRFFTGVPVPGYSTRLVNGFATKSKKIEFFSQDLLDPTRNSVNNSVNNSIYNPVLPMAMYDIAKDDFWSQDTKQYPLFCLLGPHSHYRQHSAHDANPWLNDEYRHACWISVADAKARTISDGDTVRVHNDTGEVIMPAYVTPRILPGIVAVPWGGYYEASQVKTDVMPDGIDIRGAGNVLTHDYPVRGGNLPARAVVQVEKF